MGNGFLPNFIYNPFDNVFNDPLTADLAFVHYMQENQKNNEDKYKNNDDDYEEDW